MITPFRSIKFSTVLGFVLLLSTTSGCVPNETTEQRKEREASGFICYSTELASRCLDFRLGSVGRLRNLGTGLEKRVLSPTACDKVGSGRTPCRQLKLRI
jgi:hypothetical protein